MYTFLEGYNSSTSEGKKVKIVTISVDTEEEIPSPEDDWGCGSSCIISNTHNVKFLNSEGEWK